MDKTTLKAKGFVLGDAQLLPAQPNKLKVAMDAAIPLITGANVALPELFASYVDPEVIEILTAPLAAESLFEPAKTAEWKDDVSVMKEIEAVARTAAYSDFGKGVTSDVNINFPTREHYRFQTLIEVGDLETERTAAAKINLLSEKQQAAARAIAQDRNEFALFGVAGLDIYGLLNEPNLPSAITPTTEGGQTAWATKGAVGIYNDVLKLFADMQTRTQGLVKFDTPMVLAIPPSVAGYMAGITNLGVAPVMEMITRHFPNLRVEPVPQLKDEAGVEKAMLIAQEISGKKVGRMGFSDLLRTSRTVMGHTSLSQKWSAGTTGCMLYRPMGVSTMTGIQQS